MVIGRYYRYLFVVKKVFYFSELHLCEVTFYKIHILVSKLELFFAQNTSFIPIQAL